MMHMSTKRILTTLALSVLMLAPGTVALQGEVGATVGGGGPYELDPWASAIALCSDGYAFARAQAMGDWRFVHVRAGGSSGTATHDDGTDGSNYDEEIESWSGSGSTNAVASAWATRASDGQTGSAARSCSYREPGSFDWPLMEVAMAARKVVDEVYALPELGCVSDGGPDRDFAGLLGIDPSGRWVMSGLLDGAPAVLPAGIVSGSTLPVDDGVAALTDVPVSVSFKAGHCDVVVAGVLG